MSKFIKQFEDQLGYSTLKKLGKNAVLAKAEEIFNAFVEKAPAQNRTKLSSIFSAYAGKAETDSLAEIALCVNNGDTMGVLKELNNWYINNK